MTIDKQALRQLAEKAISEEGDVWWSERQLSHEDGLALHDTDAKFIAAATPASVLALLDELEAKDSTIATQQQEIRTLLNALEQATEKRNSDRPGQKRLIGWRASDYTDETSDPELAKNWAAAIGVLPIFEGDVNTKLSAAGIGIKGESNNG
ncbi:ead/Ea22-like family protein [Citrobacter sp. CK183]|uniref:ead/Ea22-like family protein n=1 Tax=Citrobacter sp. CK183 TaxID=2985092 RepID=UPI0025768823|nr:ead/Ea22-like family protein [Citrobacter sp. CK183]MDM3050917.1 ead/Ea22-like family protein [Citrobacter sp. CK183]